MFFQAKNPNKRLLVLRAFCRFRHPGRTEQPVRQYASAFIFPLRADSNDALHYRVSTAIIKNIMLM